MDDFRLSLIAQNVVPRPARFEGEGGGDGDGGGGDGGNKGGGDGGGSGGDGGDDVKTQIAAAVETATEGLKNTNAALKTEKTELKTKFDTLNGHFEKLGGDEGIGALLAIQERFSKDEQGKLLSEGKYDEWYEQRTDALRKDHANQIEQVEKKYTDSNSRAEALESKLRQTVLKADVLSAAKDASIKPEAVADVQLRAERAFSFDQERDMLVIKDEAGGVLFGKDGKTPKSVAEWLDEQKETARHWWPDSQGGGAGGSGDPAGGGTKDLSSLPYPEFKRERAKQTADRRSY